MSSKDKSAGRITVRVNGIPVELYRGMKVKHALISLNYECFRRAEQGLIRIEDANGYAVDLEGALQDGSEIIIKQVSTN